MTTAVDTYLVADRDGSAAVDLKPPWLSPVKHAAKSASLNSRNSNPRRDRVSAKSENTPFDAS